MGRWLILAGLVLVILGLVLSYAPRAWWQWFGRLPGDIRIEKQNVRVYIPWVSMLLVSVVLSLVLALFRRLRP
ncbi:MAG: DUF2905 domain-containing protein [Flavobacteriales bacterium]|nr:DUF2905 domain-containing protein [Flavobacteriales bacterium]MDW8432391.1 DUF2905 domain-containing protein [Flavobacteriales bacterium]